MAEQGGKSLPMPQWRNRWWGYGQNRPTIIMRTTTKHNKPWTICITIGKYCKRYWLIGFQKHLPALECHVSTTQETVVVVSIALISGLTTHSYSRLFRHAYNCLASLRPGYVYMRTWIVSSSIYDYGAHHSISLIRTYRANLACYCFPYGWI